MEKDLRNKVILITGGAQGLGLCIADNFLKKGAKHTIIADIDVERGSTAVKHLNKTYGADKADFFKCDVTRDIEDTFEKIFKKYNKIDVLVNNAGILNDKNIQKTIGINVTALIECSMKFFEKVRADKGGSGGTVVNLASIYGYRVDPYLPVYQASKFAVMGFTRSFGHPDRAKLYRVRCIAICPGFTETALTQNIGLVEDDKDVLVKDFVKMLEGALWQKEEAVGKAAVEIFEKADSGSAWLIEGSKPIVEV